MTATAGGATTDRSADLDLDLGGRRRRRDEDEAAADEDTTAEDRRRVDDRSASELDDDLDREELHDRYYGLLQELRVLLPGVQILVAFLFTVPFASGFDQLDEVGRDLYGVALVSGILAVVFFTTPTVFHRVGSRRSRSRRLQWGIRATRAGLVLLAVSLLSGLVLVARVVLDPRLAVAVTVIVGVALLVMWVIIPVFASNRRDR
jgi:hypothetical protein